jgi:class 3 adenylate cyclase
VATRHHVGEACPETVVLAKKLARYPVNRRKRSLRDVVAGLAAAGHETRKAPPYGIGAIAGRVAVIISLKYGACLSRLVNPRTLLSFRLDAATSQAAPGKRNPRPQDETLEIVPSDHGRNVGARKFIGDAMLAIFPVEDDGVAAGRNALGAVRVAKAAVSKENERRASAGRSKIRYGLALHVGDVM